MWPNKNSSREEVLGYIEMHPYHFLRNFSDKPWAQPYIDEAAKRAVKEDPIYFLCNFSDKPWAQPYIYEAIKISIAFSPFSFLYDFSDDLWAQPYINDAVREAAKKDPELFLKIWANKYPQGINFALFALGSENVAK